MFLRVVLVCFCETPAKFVPGIHDADEHTYYLQVSTGVSGGLWLLFLVQEDDTIGLDFLREGPFGERPLPPTGY